ncbi:hypothetical protein DFQ27_008865 [Actinomortierella ambigua]|uniref:C2 domain-containing protein n=1 Tax=Actinomortierella ambigua TaxID=1343610 RepID=A0A9P6QHJ6_9FUNG|nr:hypothetical protein DFQ27_008865 [Actinomortierella ambigua]
MYNKTLDVHVHSASGLKDVERHGKNDPFVRFYMGVHHDHKDSVKTFAAHNAGVNPVWNQTVHIENLSPDAHVLYLEIMDRDRGGVDDPIAFAAISLSQVENLDGPFSGSFTVYDIEGNPHGSIDLTLRIRSKDEPSLDRDSCAELTRVQGKSLIIPEHKKHMRHLKFKDQLDNVAKLGIGAGLAGMAASLLGRDDDGK